LPERTQEKAAMEANFEVRQRKEILTAAALLANIFLRQR
jgi:hypothetical protein